MMQKLSDLLFVLQQGRKKQNIKSKKPGILKLLKIPFKTQSRINHQTVGSCKVA